MTTGEGIVIATPIAGLFVTIITFIIKRKPKEPPMSDKSSEMFERVLTSQNKIMSEIAGKVGKIETTVNGTHNKVNSMELIARGQEGNLNSISGDVEKIETSIGTINTNVGILASKTP